MIKNKKQSPKMQALLVSLQQQSEGTVVPTKSDFEDGIISFNYSGKNNN